MDGDEKPLVLSGRCWPGFQARTVVIASGGSHPFVESEWRDALVVVESGTVHLQTNSGQRREFRPGDMLWLTGLGLRCLINEGTEPVVLKAVSRRPSSTSGTGE